jgi:hypothetical protein
MAKKYTRKQLGSLNALDKEQARIRNKSKEIELDFLSTLNPQQLAMSLLGNVLSRKIKGGGSKEKGSGKKQGSSSGFAFDASQANLKGIVKHPLFKKLLKKVGISFLQWQAFNLALFAGKKIVKVIKQKKQEKKLQRKVETMTAKK